MSGQRLDLTAGRVLHVGCGASGLPDWIKAGEVVTVDIDERAKPDVVADMRALPESLRDFDAIYCSHALEHVSRPDAVLTLRNFARCLRRGGLVAVVVPNLEGVHPDDRVLYESEAGPVTGADLHYGMQSLIDRWPHMAHRFGYVPRTLLGVMSESGLNHPQAWDLGGYNLLGMGTA